MSELGREVNGTGMPEVAYRILFNITSEVGRLEVMLFAEMLNRFRSLDVLWDLTVMSHGQGKGQQRARAVEVVLYRDDEGNYQNAKPTLTDFLKSNNIPYRLMSDVTN
jgi:hypothetical protein